MKTLPWDAPRRVEELRERIWLHLTPSVDYEEQLLSASLLLQLPPNDLVKLGRLHFLLSEEAAQFIAALPHLLRRLSSTTADEEEWSTERVRGSVLWNKTLSARAISGMPHAYVTAPTKRAYQTPENELLVFMLDTVVRLAKETLWLERATRRPGEDLTSRFDAALRTSQHRALQSIARGPITPRKITRIRSGRGRRRYGAVLQAYEVYMRLVGRAEPQAIRDAVEQRGLVTRSDSTLFELLTTFRVMDALEEEGWQLTRLRIFGGSLQTRARRGDAEVRLWYQSVPQELTRVSRYRSLVQAHGMPASTLIPDLVLRLRHGDETRHLIVEAKLGDDSRRSGRRVEESARAALKDLLMYRRDYASVLRDQPAPTCLGVAWGEELVPAREEIMLATPDMLPKALQLWVA